MTPSWSPLPPEQAKLYYSNSPSSASSKRHSLQMAPKSSPLSKARRSLFLPLLPIIIIYTTSAFQRAITCPYPPPPQSMHVPPSPIPHPHTQPLPLLPSFPPYEHKAGRKKAVYVCPTRSLAQERVRDWSDRLACLGISLMELTGDSSTDFLDAAAVEKADLICTTPEKLDAVTRRNKDNGGMG